MSSELQEIEDLIARMALKDRAAFRNVYSRTSAKLFGVVLRVLDDRAEAEDVLQDVYVKVWNNADRYRANGLSPMTWLISIARNAAIDRKRRARHSTSGDLLTATLADPAPGPETMAIQSSERDRLDGCFGELDQRHADAVRRAYLDGDTYAELAERYNVPLNTMRTWLRRSLMKLKECLER